MSSYTAIVAGNEELETPPRSVPAACERKLASAERRLRGAIAHDVPRARMVADAERVRRAHLGVVKARTQAAAFPTEIESDEREQYLANLADADLRWRELPVDEIIARYSAK